MKPLPRRHISMRLFLHHYDNRAVRPEPHLVGSPRDLRILTLRLSVDPRRNDARPDQIVAHRRRALGRKLAVALFLADRAGVSAQPDNRRAALPCTGDLT